MGSIVSGLGNMLTGGGGGPSIGFRAQAPVNKFQATQAGLDEEKYRDLIQNLQQQAMTGGAQQGMTRDQQMQFIQALQAQMAGKGPSLAQSQLTQAADEATKRAAGQVGSMVGLNPALQQRLIAENTANTQLGLAGESGRLRLQEQLGTQGLLEQALAQARGQDISGQGAAISGVGTAGALAGGEQARALQNYQQTQQLNAEVARGNQLAESEAQRINAGIAEKNAQLSAQASGGFLSGLGGIAGTIFGPLGSAIGSKIGSLVSPETPQGGAKGGMVAGKDSEAYDVIDAKLSPGEIVLPRSVTQKDDAPERAKAFVQHLQKRSRGGRAEGGYAEGGKAAAKEPNYGPVLAKLKRIKRELGALGV